MTGRELILYILQNNLENEDVFQDGKFIALKSLGEVAEECGVGKETVHAWAKLNMIPSVFIGKTLYITANYVSPLEGINDRKNKNISNL